MNHMTVCAVNYVMCRISVMLTLTSYGLVFSLWHNPAYLFENISLHFCQGPDNTDVFMAPIEDDKEQIAEEVMKESKIIQEEIKSLFSEVYLVDVGFCFVLYHFTHNFSATENKQRRGKADNFNFTESGIKRSLSNMCVCVRARARARVRACVCVCLQKKSFF